MSSVQGNLSTIASESGKLKSRVSNSFDTFRCRIRPTREKQRHRFRMRKFEDFLVKWVTSTWCPNPCPPHQFFLWIRTQSQVYISLRMGLPPLGGGVTPNDTTRILFTGVWINRIWQISTYHIISFFGGEATFERYEIPIAQQGCCRLYSVYTMHSPFLYCINSPVVINRNISDANLIVLWGCDCFSAWSERCKISSLFGICDDLCSEEIHYI